MEGASQSAEVLKKQIAETESQLARLKVQLASLETVNSLKHVTLKEESHEAADEREGAKGGIDEKGSDKKWPLSAEEYKRYGRQMIVPSVGLQGQLRLKAASILIVGAGGLGCPAAAYLAGAGVGTIGIIDGDTVEMSNLHRQILHNSSTIGMKKVDSAIQYLKSLNPNPIYVGHTDHLSPQNAAEIVASYDLLLDCTDHPTSRYLISDICVLLGKPLVSASALRTDGQLLVLNSPALPPGDTVGGPCYRCVFPKPPPAESVVSCGDGGILGPVVGVMGVLQALEALKLISSGKLGATAAVEGEAAAKNEASMLLFSSNSKPPFRTVRLRGRRAGCFACSSTGSLALESLSSGSLDYVQFCGVTHPISILKPEERISASEYSSLKQQGKRHVLVDVREKVQFDICSIEGSINVPFSTVQGSQPLAAEGETPLWLPGDLSPDEPIYVVCRLGNDSQVIARKLKDAGLGEGRYIGDIKDGLKAWRREVDDSWPEY